MDEKKELNKTEGEVKQTPKKKKFIQVYRPQNATSKEGKDFTKHGQTAQKEKAKKEAARAAERKNAKPPVRPEAKSGAQVTPEKPKTESIHTQVAKEEAAAQAAVQSTAVGTKAAETKAVETKAVETGAAEAKAVVTKAAEVKAAEARAAEFKQPESPKPAGKPEAEHAAEGRTAKPEAGLRGSWPIR